MNPSKGRTAILERLREGPLPTTEAHTVAADSASLKVLIYLLRKSGFDIVSEPDPGRATNCSSCGAPRIPKRAIRYRLKSEPKGLS